MMPANSEWKAAVLKRLTRDIALCPGKQALPACVDSLAIGRQHIRGYDDRFHDLVWNSPAFHLLRQRSSNAGETIKGSPV